MGGREILTLQFGHFSNFVGTHLWNIQEQSFDYSSTTPSEIDNDVLYREGVNDQRQVTFTPRLLLVDLKGSLKTLSEWGDLYDAPRNPSVVEPVWEKSLLEVQKSEPETKNEFQIDLDNPKEPVTSKSYNLDNEVQVWSDFLYSRFHPRTVNVVKQYQHKNQNTPFDSFPLGTELWKTSQFSDEFSDKIRIYIEECDNFQGFHILSDCGDAYSGLTSSCLEHLKDEYDRKSILVCPLLPSYFPDNDFDSDAEKVQSIINDSVRVLNLTMGMNSFSEHASLVVPMSTSCSGWRQPGPKIEFNHLEYNHKLPYHTSAILASAFDSFTLKYRSKGSNFTLMDLAADLTLHGRKVVAASLCMPFGINEDADLLDCLDKWDGPLTKSITPRCKIGTSRVMQHITIRGLTEDRLKKPPNKAGKQRNLPAYQSNTIKEMLSLYMSFTTDATATNVTVVEKPLNVRTPFPRIFDKRIGVTGNVSIKTRDDAINIEHIPVVAGLHNDPEIGKMLESLHTEARKIKIARFHQFVDCIDKDEYEECLDNLFTLRENYEDSYLL